MSSLDFLYISLGVGFLTLVGFLCYLIKISADTLIKTQRVIDDVGSTTDTVVTLKDQLSSSALRVVGKFLKGGDYVTG